MIHRRSITLLFLLSGLALQAQFPFAELYYQGDNSPYALDGERLALRADGRPVLLCSGDTLHMNGLDTNGQVEWTAAIARPEGYQLVVADVLPLADGSLAACGFIHQPAPEVGLYLRLDTMGHVLSAKTYQLDLNTRLFAMAANSDGTVRLTGYRQTASPPDYAGVVLDVDTGGNVLATSQLTIGGHPTLPNALIGTADGGHVLVGGSWLLSSGGQVLNKTAHIAKLDSAGQVQWARRVQADNQRTFPQGVVRTAHGDILYAMRAEFQQGSKLILVSYGPDGDLVHAVQLDPGAPSDGYLDVATCSLQGDSILVLSGFTNVIDDLFTLRVDTGLTSPHLLLREPQPGEWISDQVILSEGRILQAAYAASPNGGNGILLTGLAPNGEAVCTNTPCAVGLSVPDLVANEAVFQEPVTPTVTDLVDAFPPAVITLLTMPLCLNTGSISAMPDPGVRLAPNPVQDRLGISAPAIEAVTLWDVMGRKLMTRGFPSLPAVELDLQGWTPGAYVVRIICAEGAIERRVIKE